MVDVFDIRSEYQILTNIEYRIPVFDISSCRYFIFHVFVILSERISNYLIFENPSLAECLPLYTISSSIALIIKSLTNTKNRVYIFTDN